MNKDVIYIESEDDITDIITKIEKSKEKIIALVPPKRAGVFRSIVNMKLIAKAGAAAGKSVVLVTVDPSIIKLAATTKLPVAKNLQSAPVIPTVEKEADSSTHSIDEIDNDADEDEIADESEEAKAAKDIMDEEDEDANEDEEQEEVKKKEKKPKKQQKNSGHGPLGWLKSHKKISIFGGICALALVAFLVWALGFAPAVDISVAIKADPRNFSESITFTDNLASEDAKQGVFYLERKEIESVQEVNFEATGQKNNGEKATGEVTVIATVSASGGTKVINTGDTFTIDGLSYVADNSVTMHYDGKDDTDCENAGSVSKREFDKQGCKIYKTVKVTATSPGTAYNIAASESGWNTTANVAVYSTKPMTGGTDDIVTVVQQSDIENAKAELTSANEEENKKKLLETIDDKYYIVEPSFEQSTSAVTATPGVDEEVKEGEHPSLKATTTASVYVIDKVKLEEFINEKAELEDGQKIYEIKDMYIENPSHIASGVTSKLKAQYYVGPKITETDVVEKVKGKGLGDAGREIRDFYGVSDVKIEPSYPWVMMVPTDSNRITVKFEIKDQEGNELKLQDNTQSDDANTDQSGESNDDSASEDTQSEE